MKFYGTSLMLAGSLFLSLSAYAADPQPAPGAAKAFSADSQMVISISRGRVPSGEPAGDHACFSMRTYRVRKDLDQGSLIPAEPTQAEFDPDNIVAYSICQPAGKYVVKSTSPDPGAK